MANRFDLSKVPEDIINILENANEPNLRGYRLEALNFDVDEFFDGYMAGRSGGKVSPQVEAKYLPFGKYIVDMKNLKDGRLLLKYPSKAKIAGFPTTMVTSKFKNLMCKIVKNQNFTQKDVKCLSKPESKLLQKVIMFSKLDQGEESAISHLIDEDGDKDVERFNLLKGELLAGNNSNLILKELKPLIVKLMRDNTIKKQEGMELLTLLCM